MPKKNQLILVPQVELDLLVELLRRRPGNSDDIRLQELIIGSLYHKKPPGRELGLKILKRKQNG